MMREGWLLGWVVGGVVVLLVVALLLVLIVLARRIAARAAAIRMLLEETESNTAPLWGLREANRSLRTIAEHIRRARRASEGEA